MCKFNWTDRRGRDIVFDWDDAISTMNIFHENKEIGSLELWDTAFGNHGYYMHNILIEDRYQKAGIGTHAVKLTMELQPFVVLNGNYLPGGAGEYALSTEGGKLIASCVKKKIFSEKDYIRLDIDEE